jgi:hypothetical protein
MKLLKYFIQKILHSSSDFDFGLVNIFSKHSNIPFQNNQRWEIHNMPLMFKTNNFLGSIDDEHRCKHIELPLTTIINLDETLN